LIKGKALGYWRNHRATIKEFVGKRKKHEPKARGNARGMHRKLNDSRNECREGARGEMRNHENEVAIKTAISCIVKSERSLTD